MNNMYGNEIWIRPNTWKERENKKMKKTKRRSGEKYL